MNNSLDRVSRKVLERFTDLLGFVVSLKVVCVFFAVALASTLNAQDSDAEVVDAAFAAAREKQTVAECSEKVRPAV